MANLPEIKKYISTTQNTRKITQAMQLVAATKMKYFQREAIQARSYAWGLLEGLSYAGESWRELPFAEVRESGPTLFVVLTSDKGLCGSLNTRVLTKIFTSNEWKETPSEERLLVTIGRKSYEAATRRKFPVLEHFTGISEQLNPLDALHIINKIVSHWEEKKCKKVVFVSTHYVNPFTTVPNLKTYLPFTKEMIEEHLRWKNGDIEAQVKEVKEEIGERLTFFEPSAARVHEALAYQLIQTMFMQAFFEFKAAEYSSRMIAMKKATEAADELIGLLTREYNKGRQSRITQELAELAAGSEAVTEESADMMLV